MKDPVDRNAMAREENIFDAAVQLTDSVKRSAFLDQACAGDQALRARIEKLLAAADDTFFDQPLATPPPLSASEAPTDPVTAGTDVAAPDLTAEAHRQRIGCYKLLQKIGEGGCGTVYMAEQTEPLRRRVALKVIKLGMDTESVIARFEAERQALALMDHPNIAKVLDAGATEAGRPYFVMELVRGVKITEFCDQNHVSTRGRLELLIQVCQAIQHAHQKGIIHRDIKPSNILVTVNDGVPVPKVIDFGIAKATAGQQLTDKTLFTAFEQFIGTPAYMSPEQAVMTSLDIDTRTDIYALGVLLYELLTGKTPFDAKELLAAGLEEMRRTIQEKEPVRPSTRLRTMLGGELATTAKDRQSDAPKLINLLQGDLDWIVMKSLEKDRTRRYDTANGLAMDIQRHLNDEPVVARPPSAAYRIGKAIRRNKLAFTAAAMIAGALLLGAVVSTWQAVRATHLSEAAKKAEAKANDQEKLANERALQAEQEKTVAHRLLYVANMNSAQHAWEQNNVGRLRQLLDDTQGFPDRGFEWFYWQRQCHLERTILRGHGDQVAAVAFSPDGQRIVTGSDDRTAIVWEAASGNKLFTLKGHRSWITSVAFSPDGQWIVTASVDQTARIWQAATGKELLILKGHLAPISSVAFSPDGQRIVTGSEDNTAMVWDALSGKALLPPFQRHSDMVACVAFSPDGQRIITGSDDKTAIVWEAANGTILLPPLEGHTSVLKAVGFSPDGQRMITASWDKTAKVWEAASGKELFTLQGHRAGIRSVAFSQDGQRIVTGSADQTAKVWDAAGGKELFTLRGHYGEINSVAFSGDGHRIVTGSEDGTARVWEAVNSDDQLAFQPHTDRVFYAMALSADGQRIIASEYPGPAAQVWDTVSGTVVYSLEAHTSLISSAAFSPDRQRIVTGSYDHTAIIWDAASGKPLLPPLKEHAHVIGAVAFSSDGKRIATGCDDLLVKVWDAATGSCLWTNAGHTAGIWAVAFSPDGSRLATGSYDNMAKVWDANTGENLLTLNGHKDPISSVAFSPNGGRVVTASSDHTVKIWDAINGALLFTLSGHSRAVASAAFSPDGRRIVTAGTDQTVKVWETTSGREVLSLRAFSEQSRRAIFSEDGQRIICASSEPTEKVWQAATREPFPLWLKEEKAADASASLRRQERKQAAAEERDRASTGTDAGVIRQWLVLVPADGEGGKIAAALEQNDILDEADRQRRNREYTRTRELEQKDILDEANRRPHSGDRVKVGEGERVWNVAQLKDYVLDFTQLLRDPSAVKVGYAVCYIECAGDQTNLVMKVGSPKASIYLNGKEVYRRTDPRRYQPDQEVVAGVDLKAGLNTLLFMVRRASPGWNGSVRFTDDVGQPVKGFRVILDPSAQ